MLLHRNDWLIVSQKHYPTTKHVIIVHLARSNVSSSSIHRQWREFRLVLRLWNIRKEHSRSFAMLTSPRAFLTMWHRKMTSIRITNRDSRARAYTRIKRKRYKERYARRHHLSCTVSVDKIEFSLRPSTWHVLSYKKVKGYTM